MSDINRTVVTEDGETYPKWSGGYRIWDKGYIEIAEKAYQLGYKQACDDAHDLLEKAQEECRAALNV
jgi:hypothetical protein